MTFPNIPDVGPAIDIDRKDVISILLASIAFEELGLAHIINAEAEKIQCVLGTLQNDSNDKKEGGHHWKCPSIDDLLAINDSVNGTLRTVIKNQMLLQFKLEDILAIDEDKHEHDCKKKDCK